MSRFLIIICSLIAVVVTPNVISAQVPACKACDLIERDGDKALEELKSMSHQELSAKSTQGETPFYWSLFHGNTEIRNFLVSTLKKEELGSTESLTQFFSACANHEQCPKESLKYLHGLGFKPDKKAAAAAVSGTQKCDIVKFQLLNQMGSPLNLKNEEGFNILHQIVDRSRSGRPIFERKCLVSAIKVVIKSHPELKGEKNSEGFTPLELARHFQKTKTEWGTNITSKSIQPIVTALLK